MVLLQSLTAETLIPQPHHAANVQSLTSQVLTIYKHLSDIECREGLDPSPRVNALFTSLVRLVEEHRSGEDVSGVLVDPVVKSIVPHLRRMCGAGEFLLEVFWAEKIVKNHSSCKITDFPYYTNYIDLTRMELHAILSVSDPTHPPSKFVFLGSGPLPLTSICLANELHTRRIPKINIHNIDRDATAINLSSTLTLGLGEAVRKAMTFQHANVAETDIELEGFDAVYLAALVGMDIAEKQRVLDRVWKSMKSGALLVVRSAHSLRGLMYPVVETDSLPGFAPLLVVHPHNHVINSVLIARRI